MEDHYIFWIKALYMGLYLHWIASSLLTYDAFILPHQNKYYKSTKTERWKCGLIEQKTISCSKEQSVRWQPQESSEMLQTVREANSTKTFWDNASKKLFKIPGEFNDGSPDKPFKPFKPEAVAWLQTRDTRENIIPEIKNVLRIRLCHKPFIHSFIHSSSSFSALNFALLHYKI